MSRVNAFRRVGLEIKISRIPSASFTINEALLLLISIFIVHSVFRCTQVKAAVGTSSGH